MDLKRYATESKYKLLKNIEDSSKTQSRIAQDINTSQQSVSIMIQALETENLVKHKSLYEGYSITEKGETLLKNLEDIINL